MSRNTRVLFLGGVFLLLLVVGVVAVTVLANRPFVDYRVVSPTALPQFDPFVETQAAQQTQTRDALLINLTAAMDTRVQNMHAASLNPSPSALPPPSTTAQVQSGDCGWMWATQINPELSAVIQQRLDDSLANIDSVEAHVEGFGENCLNRDGSVRYFATMETHFRVVVHIGALETLDEAAVQDIMSPVVLDILRVLADYPVDDTPGPMPGQISVQFPVRNTAYWLSANYNTAMDALNRGLTGGVLLDALGGLHS